MKKICLLLGTIAFVVLFTSCGSKNEDLAATGSVVGIVSDKTTGEPVDIVNVSISPGNAFCVTGSDGYFVFNDLLPGEYLLNISKEGYNPNSMSVVVQADNAAQAHMLIERIPSKLTVDKQLLDFGEELSTLSFTIVNRGYSDLAYKVEKGDCQWISVNPEFDIIEYGKTSTVVVKVDRTLLGSGRQEAVLVVQSTSGEGNVEIKVVAIGEYKAKASLNTLEPTNVTSTSATINGEITNEGAPAYTERGFVWNTQNSPTMESKLDSISVPVTSESKFSSNINNLKPDATYYVRAYLIQNGEYIYGNTVVIGTAQQNAEISTSAVTQIGANTATFNASILNEGAPSYTERGFCYGTRGEPTVADNRKIVSGYGTGAFSLSVSGLAYPVTYYVRAYLVQSGETIYGNTVTFTTAYVPVSVTTSAATKVTDNSARLNGVISNVGEPQYTQRGFCYSKYSYSPTISDDKISETNYFQGNYYKDITGLEAGQTYYVRAFAIQDGEPVYGNTVMFTTNRLPEVITNSVTQLAPVDMGGGFYFQWSAKFNAIIVDSGSPEYISRGFVYNTTANPTAGSGTKVPVSGRGTGSYSVTVSNLSNYQIYYVRAYVQTSSGYVYGDDVTFITMD